MKILVIEDEKKSALYLEKGLRESGYEVDVAEQGDVGLKMALEGEYDLIILDVMLPVRDGWSVMADLRKGGKQTPVLFLTARDTVDDRVKGLELGADDYLVKPFAFSELLARVRSVLRRNPQRQPGLVKVGDLELDLFKQRALRAGKKLDLTPKEFSLLSLLARRSGEVLSRNIIAEQVWDMNFESDTNVVDVHVRRLRSKLDDPYESKLIHTVRGVGYVLNDRA
ncbi:MAG TPA: heavy metal response regulator transcription factor [Tepidisphaeraceae bacterium]